jgi:hypothetical protein
MKATYIVMTAVLAAVNLLSGCGVHNVQLQQDRERCSQYGFQSGTNSFAKCMQDTAIERDRISMVGSLFSKIKQ